MCMFSLSKKKDIRVYPISYSKCAKLLYKQNKNLIIFEDRDYMDRNLK